MLPRVLIDDLFLNKISHTTLQERNISASQDPVFLPTGTSFRENLDPWNQATEAERAMVLRDLHLALIVTERGGLDTPLIDRVDLIAGQKQLFSLARVVLRRRARRHRTGVDGGLLLRDEMTSSTDAETTRRVRRPFRDEFATYMVFMVTNHRELAVGCDRVIALDAGRVVEDGMPSRLLGREESRFRKLFGS